MALIGEIFLKLGLSSAQLTTGLQQAKSDVRNATSQMQTAFQGLNSVLRYAGTSVAGLATGLAFLVKREIDAADRMRELSLQAGISVEKFSALAYGAKQSGVEQEALATSIVKFNRYLVAQKRGTEDVNEALLKEADYFQRLGPGALASAEAVKRFGKSGAELLPFLLEGTSGIRSLTAEAERLGVVFSTQAAEAADRFNDSLMRLQQSWRGLVISIGNAGVTDWLSDLVNLRPNSMWSFFGPLIGPQGFRFETGARLTDLSKLRSPQEKLERGMNDLTAWWRKRELSRGEPEEQKKNTAVESLIRNLRLQIAELQMNDVVFEAYKAKLLGATEAQQALVKSLYATVEALKLQNLFANAPLPKLEEVPTMLGGMQSRSIFVEQGEVAPSLRRPGDEALNAMIDAAREARQAMYELKQETIAFGQSAAHSFLEAAIQGRGFSEVLRSLLSQLAHNALQWVLNAVFSGGSSGGKGFSGFLGSLFGGARQHGGPVMPGRAYLVGERGPELFSPSQPGAITPNNALGGAAAPIFNFDNRGADLGTVIKTQQLVMGPAFRQFKRQLFEENFRTV